MIDLIEYRKKVAKMREHQESVLTSEEKEEFAIFKKYMSIYEIEHSLEKDILAHLVRGDNND